MENQLAALGIYFKHIPGPTTPRPAAKWNASTRPSRMAGPPASSADLEELQDQLDRFRAYYNTIRPHRASPGAPAGLRRPHQGPPPPEASPSPPSLPLRRDRIDTTGKVTLRYRSTAPPLGVGRRRAGPGSSS